MSKLLLKLLCATAIVGGGAYLVMNRNVSLPFANQLSQLKNPTQNVQDTMGDLTKNVSSQTKVLGERTQEVAGHVQNVVGSYVQENDGNSSTNNGNNSDGSGSGTDQSPVHEKAFEYGRYIYCQEVIKDYEANH